MPGRDNGEYPNNCHKEVRRGNSCDDDTLNAKDDSTRVLEDANGLSAAQRSCCSCEVAEPANCSGAENGNGLNEIYYQDESYDDEDDEDSDWEPQEQEPPVISKWFCTNCTMPNFNNDPGCYVCGEHRDSEIILRGHFASRFGSQAESSVEPEETVVCQENAGSSTGIGFDERMLLHSEVEMKSHPHPERPDRLRAIAASLSTAGIFPKCLLIPSREITEEELRPVHSFDHIEAVKYTSHFLCSYFTPDTYANEHSACAARLAAGICSDLSIAVMTGKVKNGFALIRPPGHHAGVKKAMGFCLHNNAAVAVKAAESVGAKKILIVDWDVHHGNGTQEIFEGDKNVLYVSLHRHENGSFYPGTGAANEVGIMEGAGFSVNIPWLTGGIGDNDYIFAFKNVILPIAKEFDPDLTIISAGFDAARGDPLGGCDVTPSGYAYMTHMISSVSRGKLLVILEGGYNLRSIASSATAVVKVLLGEIPSEHENDIAPSTVGLVTVLEVLRIQSEYWKSLKPCYDEMQSKWISLQTKRKENERKVKAKLAGPIWWKWGSKSLAYRLLYGIRKRVHKHHHRRRRSFGHRDDGL